jgi:hypothetical protein
MSTNCPSPLPDADKARELPLRALRWPTVPVFCPHCGTVGAALTPWTGKVPRAPRLWKCMDCRDQFTVTVGTVFERSQDRSPTWGLPGGSTSSASSKKGDQLSSAPPHPWAVTYKYRYGSRRTASAKPWPRTAPCGPLLGGWWTETSRGRGRNLLGQQNAPKKARLATPKKNGRIVSLVERGGKGHASFHVKNVDKYGSTLTQHTWPRIFTTQPRTYMT